MNIVRAKCAGFCYGVQRATRMAYELVSGADEPLLTIGPLMHNPQQVRRMAQRGIVPVERIEQCAGRRALVRTHGIGRGQIQLAEQLGVKLVDATCPHVELPRRRIEQWGRQGRTVLLVGDRDHPEVQAQLSYASGAIFVVSHADQLRELQREVPVGLVAQTTQSRATFDRVAQAARARFSDLILEDTICRDAQLRQAEGQRMAARVDLMLVVGGRNSANTRRLTELCRAIQPRTLQIETEAELPEISMQNVRQLGLISGASTPDWIVDQVEHRLRSQTR